MGHLSGKDIYGQLGDKLDTLPFRVNRSQALYNILRALYTEGEAELVARMPYGLSPAVVIKKATGIESGKLETMLENLSEKGLVIDVGVGKRKYYMPSPMVIGIFEFTMMRTGPGVDSKEYARLFHEYMNDERSYEVNFGRRQKISPMRALAHEGTVIESGHTEVLDYEKATSIIDSHDKFAIGICSCRHEKHHLGEKRCKVPLETCATFGGSTDYMVRHNFAKPVSKSEMLDNLARSKESGLVFSADNVNRNVSFLCQCCSCCCNLLLGISRFGYPNIIVTSRFIASIDTDTCEACGKCAKACPIDAIEMKPVADDGKGRKKLPVVNEEICIGCGVCSLKCSKTASLKLKERKKRVIHPETTFERVILQCLERGTLQHQIFGNPEKISQKMMKGIIGGFLKLSPVRKSLMSDILRSKFLDAMKRGAVKQGQGFLLRQ